MTEVKLNLKKVFKESIFGALFTLWTAPVDEPKLKLPLTKTSTKNNSWFTGNLIIGHRP